MNVDPNKLKLAGPVVSVLGALVGFFTALRSGEGRGPAVLSSFLGLVGSSIWLTMAYQDYLEETGEPELA